jgi:hypothetical protein
LRADIWADFTDQSITKTTDKSVGAKPLANEHHFFTPRSDVDGQAISRFPPWAAMR